MIVPMHKVTLLCLADDREATLRELRELGCVHVENVRPPAGEGLSEARSRLAACEEALGVLAPLCPTGADDAPDAAVEDVPARVRLLAEKARELNERLQQLAAEEAALAPLGDFDPGLVERLSAGGLTVRLYRLTEEEVRSGLTEAGVPAEAFVAAVSRDENAPCTAVAALGQVSLEAPAWPLPERSLGEVRDEIAKRRAELDAADRSLAGLAAACPGLREYALALREHCEFLEARAGMGEHSAVAYLRGYCPSERVADLRAAAARHGWGLVAEQPRPGDRVPTLIRMPRWVRPAQPLFDFLGVVPGYNETDVAPAFLVFLSIFFAMIVGDAGYGLILLALTLWLGRKFRRAPREPFRLLTIFLGATVAWGALTANYFGVDPEVLPSLLRALRIEWLAERDNSMSFCLFLGAVHLTVAHLWAALRVVNSPRALAQLGWIGVTWSLFGAARYLLLGAPFPWFYWTLLGLAVPAIVGSVVLQRDWMQLPMLPQDFISNFGDLMSYLRLFALGIAGVKVAEAFNDMAGMIGYGNILAILGAAVVLLLGHVLNIVLCGLSVLVHGVRLNALEFSLHMGQEWSGFAFRPFARRERKEA